MKDLNKKERKYILIGEKYSEYLNNALKKLGLEPVYMPDNPFVDKRLSGHADLSVFYPGGEKIFLAPYLENSEFSEKITQIGLNIHYLNIKQNEKYPFDAEMNACICGNRLIYNENVTSAEMVNNLTDDYIKISCRQGYLNCSICKVDDNSIITADRGVYEACNKAGLDALLIQPGFINLEGFDYGFIGGAGFKISEDKIAFTGSLKQHPEYSEIIRFLDEKEIEPVFLTELPAFDIGGAFLI